MSDFEDPRDLLLCIQSDCERPRTGGSPFCATHLREQEVKSAGIVEPDLEARLAHIRTEDDDHPGMVKVYDQETGEASWVPSPRVDRDAAIRSGAANLHRAFAPVGMPPPEELYVGPDPDINGTSPDLPRRAPRAHTDPPEALQTAGCWMAYHPDWSGLAVFNDELEALRHAVANSMTVGWAQWGQELGGERYPSQPSS